jgi:type IV secretory pathway TraG/TraD family ATPase VirD4
MAMYFGGLWLPDKAETGHAMIVGTTGSGKTLTLRMWMHSTLPCIRQLPDRRAVIYDEKKDHLSVLAGLGFSPEEVLITNPFDRRCWEWDMAADITGPDTALQLATLLIPEEKGPNSYFPEAARDLLTGVINTFIETAPGRWEFADLVLAMRSPQRLAHVLAQTPEGEELIEMHLEGGGTTPRNVLSTGRARLARFQVPAALWKHAGAVGRKFSLCSFMKENRILLLGNQQSARAAIQAINRLLFQRLTELILDLEESETRRVFVVLDEVRKLGRLEGLDDLLSNGRSKGVAAIIGFQSIQGMRAVYGREVAEELTEMVGSFGVLKVSGAETPEWASRIFGEQEVRQRTRSVSDGQSTGQSFSTSTTESYTEVLRERKLYLPSQFRMIPLPEKGKPLCGYFCSSFLESRPYYAEIPPAEVKKMLLPRDERVPDFLPWPNESYKQLPPWEDADYERLGIPPMPDGPRAWSGVGDASGRDQGFIDPFAGGENHPHGW